MSLCLITHGLPNTTEWDGTSQFTYEFGAISTSSPIVTFPTMQAFIPIHTLLPILGTPLLPPPISLTDENSFMDIAIIPNYCSGIYSNIVGMTHIESSSYFCQWQYLYSSSLTVHAKQSVLYFFRKR